MKKSLITLACIKSLFMGIAAVSMAAACSEDIPGGESPDGGQTEAGGTINGTEIVPGNNLVGLISDSRTGKGIAGIPVSDGYSFAVTDDNGVYQLKANRYCRQVYYSTPSEYKVSLAADSKMPLFYSTDVINKSKVNRFDFELEPLDAPESEFSFVVFSDTQVGKTNHVSRFEAETRPDATDLVNNGIAEGTVKSPYGIILGDIIYNTSAMWEPMKKAVSNWNVNSPSGFLPVFGCIGNHDYSNAESSSYASIANYVKNFGPVDYSFNRGKVHFIVMNNVIFTGNSSGGDGKAVEYESGFTDTQIAWLKQDIEFVKNKEDMAVVFCAHIPLRGDGIKNADKVLQSLTGFKEAHIMTGHTHYPQNYIHSSYKSKNGKAVYEHVHSAVCGANWWSTLNTDGTPNGYAVYSIKDASLVDWKAKSVMYPESYQMRVYNGNTIPDGPKKYKWEDSYKDCFIVTIWNDDDVNWKVEFVDESGSVTPMTRVTKGQRDWFAYAFMVNVNGRGDTNTWYHRNLKHYWYVKCPSGDPASAKNWKVRAIHTIPTSGVQHVYEETSLKTDYSGFTQYK